MKRGLLLFAAFAMFAVASPAEAAIQSVTVGSGSFSPATKLIARGDFVKWTWTGSAHSATSTGPLPWNSNVKSSGTYTTPKAFVGAGSYPYYCTLHRTMRGQIQVPIKLTAVGRKITVTLASATAPTGYEYVPQRKSGTSYVALGVPTTATTVTYTVGGPGTYTFRSALHKKGTAAPVAAVFSPPASITINVA